jgi:hypothetical protein
MREERWWSRGTSRPGGKSGSGSRRIASAPAGLEWMVKKWPWPPIPGFMPRSVSAPLTSPASLSRQVQLSRTHTVTVTRHYEPLSSAYLTRAAPPLFLPSLNPVAGTAAGSAAVLLGLHCSKTSTAAPRRCQSSHTISALPSLETSPPTCHPSICPQIAVLGPITSSLCTPHPARKRLPPVAVRLAFSSPPLPPLQPLPDNRTRSSSCINSAP